MLTNRTQFELTIGVPWQWTQQPYRFNAQTCGQNTHAYPLPCTGRKASGQVHGKQIHAGINSQFTRPR
ncbi:Uncharacterised protein [Vibrio cholerae]|nr:Uncharacterised protein [Vibrio cholerae]